MEIKGEATKTEQTPEACKSPHNKYRPPNPPFTATFLHNQYTNMFGNHPFTIIMTPFCIIPLRIMHSIEYHSSYTQFSCPRARTTPPSASCLHLHLAGKLPACTQKMQTHTQSILPARTCTELRLLCAVRFLRGGLQVRRQRRNKVERRATDGVADVHVVCACGTHRLLQWQQQQQQHQQQHNNLDGKVILQQ